MCIQRWNSSFSGRNHITKFPNLLKNGLPPEGFWGTRDHGHLVQENMGYFGINSREQGKYLLPLREMEQLLIRNRRKKLAF